MRGLIIAVTLLILGSPTLVTTAASPESVSALGNSGCELVELYPGYPGYIGYVTGVDGIGDHASLEDLEDQDRSFDRKAEDDANLKAARSLSINGGPELWTWENWMAIEAERGMVPTCYICLYDENNLRSSPTNTDVSPNDPRLLLGSFIGFDLESVVSNGRVSSNEYENFFFRSIANASNVGIYLNAEEVLDQANAFWTNYNSRGGAPTDWGSLWCLTLFQGGYAPTPASASANDQVWLVMAMYWTFANLGLNPYASEAVLATDFSPLINEWVNDWESGRTDLTFAQFADRQNFSYVDTCGVP